MAFILKGNSRNLALDSSPASVLTIKTCPANATRPKLPFKIPTIAFDHLILDF